MCVCRAARVTAFSVVFVILFSLFICNSSLVLFSDFPVTVQTALSPILRNFSNLAFKARASTALPYNNIISNMILFVYIFLHFYFGNFILTTFYFKNPLIICSSASFSVKPSVISLVICSPAILPIAAS